MPPENLRSVLVIALCVVIFLLWQAWVEDYGPKDTRPGIEETRAPGQPEPAEEEVVPLPTPMEPVSEAEEPAAIAQAETKPSGLVRVRTDVLDLEMDHRFIYKLRLLEYPVSLEEPDEPFPLLNDTLPNVFLAESGLLGSNAEPNKESVFAAERSSYELGEGEERLNVVFTWTGESGIEAKKIYTFERGRYVVDVTYEVLNNTGELWSGRMYGQFWRTQVVSSGGLFRVYTYTGGILSSPDKPYQKIDFEDMAERALDQDIAGGWLAMIQHYFAGAWVPATDVLGHYYTKAQEGGKHILGLYFDQAIPAGARGEMKLTAYLGPKIQDRMEAVADGLRRTVDYGWLFMIAQPLFWLLAKIDTMVGNWGWSIIILTVLIKLAFFHLSATSYKSMARMRKLQPRMLQIRERHSGDKQRMNQAMMELYKQEKVNPLGGCLPILVQIPVFIALYWVLLESVELRQADFIFWLKDLSQHDPWFVLPILMGASMYVQQKLNPTPPDPIQAKVMTALPFIFTFFFLFFPSGLVLYWLVNNILSIAQQWVITKRIEAAP